MGEQVSRSGNKVEDQHQSQLLVPGIEPVSEPGIKAEGQSQGQILMVRTKGHARVRSWNQGSEPGLVTDGWK